MILLSTLCFTGHRPNKLKGYNPKDNKELLWFLHDIIVDCVENYAVDTFITGMALGIDTWAARIVLKLKEKYPHIKLVAAVPCDKQWAKWSAGNKAEWEDIISKADTVHYVTKTEYTAHCMQLRNEWMVDQSDYVIAVWDGSSGGTGNCVRYAESKHKEIIGIHPVNSLSLYTK